MAKAARGHEPEQVATVTGLCAAARETGPRDQQAQRNQQAEIEGDDLWKFVQAFGDGTA